MPIVQKVDQIIVLQEKMPKSKDKDKDKDKDSTLQMSMQKT